MKKLLSLVLAGTMVLGMLAGCGKKEGDSGKDDTSPIKIGYVSALTGDTALWGQAGLDGMKMAAEKVNADGGVLGRKVEVLEADGKGEPQDSVTALQSLIGKGVVAVVGTNFSNCNIAMAPIADSSKVSVIGTAASNPEVTVDKNGKLHPYSFRLGFIDPFQGTVLASYAYNKLGLKNAAILTNVGDATSAGITEYFKDGFTGLGGKIVAEESGGSNDDDFRAQLAKIKDANPDVLFIPWNYQKVANIAKQAKALGINCQFIGGDGWDSQDLPDLAGGAIEGGIYCSRPGFADPKTADFKKEYMEKYNITSPEAEVLFGWDGMMWVVDAIKRANSADPEKVRDALENTGEWNEGYLGPMKVDPATHNPERAAGIFQIKDNKVTYIESYTPDSK